MRIHLNFARFYATNCFWKKKGLEKMLIEQIIEFQS